MFFGHTKRRAAYSDEGLVASDSWFSHKQQLETLSLSLSWRRILSLGVGGVSADQGDQGGKGPGPRQAIDTTCFVSVCVCICARGERRNGRKPLRIRIHPNKRNTDQLDSSSHALRLRHCSKATAAVIISKESHFEEEKRKKILFFFFLLWWLLTRCAFRTNCTAPGCPHFSALINQTITSSLSAGANSSTTQFVPPYNTILPGCLGC